MLQKPVSRPGPGPDSPAMQRELRSFSFFLFSNALKTEATEKSCKSLSGGGVGPDSPARFLATPRNAKGITVIFLFCLQML